MRSDFGGYFAAGDSNVGFTPVYSIATMEQLLSGSTLQRRFNMTLLAVFAALALILAGMGIYGVMAYAVTERTREIGIRMALGAQMSDALRLVIRQGMRLPLVGVTLGLMGAFALTRLMENLLFNVKATDPPTFIVMVASVKYGSEWLLEHKEELAGPRICACAFGRALTSPATPSSHSGRAERNRRRRCSVRL